MNSLLRSRDCFRECATAASSISGYGITIPSDNAELSYLFKIIYAVTISFIYSTV